MTDVYYDLIIAGSGPAGLSAAIYAARAQLRTIVIEKAPMSGGQIINTDAVDNYPGMPDVNGFELAQKFREHCDKLEVVFAEGEITKVQLDGDEKCILLEDGTMYKGSALIICTGAQSSKLSIAGETRLSGAGVSYCAVCDGAFFKGKTVAVVGGGDTALGDAVFLSRLCKKVYIIHRREAFRAARTLIQKLEHLQNIEIIWNSVVEEILGEERVNGLKLKNTENGSEMQVLLDGVFIAIGSKPNTEAFTELVEMDGRGYILADESCRTSRAGIFVAGDARTKALRQIITAASDGANAVFSVEQYLNQKA